MLILFDMVLGCVPPMIGCEFWAFLTWFLDVSLPWSDVSAGCAFLTWFLDVFLSCSDVSARQAILTEGKI